ncbi:hypothetical protein [Xanthomonas sp. MUS 060]|uniref:hypothetical protein n=1 Tax=Xanthomonas sp. MUS 060 TaxID=1588031 RepID=UPI0006988669|nr:hypothetical protein [Xanthomonas sp. MUS 060]
MRKHVFMLSRKETDHWCRTLHIDVLSLARTQRQRRFRRRLGCWVAALLAMAALLALVLLLQGLSAALLDAQCRCRVRHAQALRACFGSDDVLQVAAVEPGAPPLQIPLWELRVWQLPQIGQLALSFDVELDVLEIPGEAPRLLLHVLSQRPRRPGHRLQVLFHGTQAPVGEVLFDGQCVKLWNLSADSNPDDRSAESEHA